MSIDVGAWQRSHWQAGENLHQMLGLLAILGRWRSLRQFALACTGLVRDRITDPRALAAVAFAERYVQSGVARRKGRPAVAAAAAAATEESALHWPPTADNPLRLDAVVRLVSCQAAAALVDGNDLSAAVGAAEGAARILYMEWAAANGHWPPDWHQSAVRDAHRAEQRALVALLRCVAGDPFRPPVDAAAWRAATVVAIARGIDAERAFDRLPILADAMQDAGCEDAEALDHCGGPGPHARGCWVVERALGRG